MTLLEVLQSQLDDQTVNQISQQIGAEPEQTKSAATGIFATMLGGMANNAATPEGMDALTAMLDKDQDGSILDDLGGMFGGMMGGGETPQAPATGFDAAGILGGILGNRQETATNEISRSTGLDTNQIINLMITLAPVVIGVISRLRSRGNLQSGDLAGILTGSAEQASNQSGMGDLLGSVLGGVLGGGGQRSAGSSVGADVIGSVLSGIFGKR